MSKGYNNISHTRTLAVEPSCLELAAGPPWPLPQALDYGRHVLLFGHT